MKREGGKTGEGEGRGEEGVIRSVVVGGWCYHKKRLQNIYKISATLAASALIHAATRYRKQASQDMNSETLHYSLS